jgi:hypothetical protein
LEEIREKFVLNMDEFQKAGYLSLQHRHILDTILDAGHAATHRAWVPTDDDIATLIDIAENLAEMVYVHKWRAQTLEKRFPKRGRPKARDQAR